MKTFSLSARTFQIAALALLGAVAAATAWATHSWGGYHWARTTPQFTLKLGDNMTTANWKSRLSQASGDWNSPTTFGASSFLRCEARSFKK